MKAETFAAVNQWIKQVCVLPNDISKDSLIALYGELKDKYTDEEIVQASREIVNKEDLFNNYPTLKHWMKYCPGYQQHQNQEKDKKAEFIGYIAYAIDEDPMIYDWQQCKEDIRLKIGWHGYNACKYTGILIEDAIRIGKTTAYNKSDIIKKFSEAWDKTDDRKTKIVQQIGTERNLYIEKK